MSSKVKANLLSIIEAADKIKSFITDLWDADALYKDQKTLDAVLMNFIVIGESVNRLPKEFTSSNEHIPWVSIRNFRNIIAHNYFGIDVEEVWQIIHNDLIPLRKQIQVLIDSDKAT